MNISISKELVPNGKYTKEAKLEITEQVVDFVTKVCEEAERIELTECKDVQKIQITPNSIQKAANYVIRYRIEKKTPHWSIAHLCPFLNAIGGAVLSAALFADIEDQTKTWLLVVSCSLLVGLLVVQTMYHKLSK